MSDGSSTLAHQFDDLEQQREASTLGMWAFLITEIMFFGGLFLGYSVYRFNYPEAFAEGSHHLDVTLGSINTTVLIGSSLTMALAVRGAQLGRRNTAVGSLLLTVLLGCVFLGIKAVEYGHKFEEQLVPGTSFGYSSTQVDPGQLELFFSFYFAMTGLHAFHMIIGIAILLVLVWKTWKGRFTPSYYAPLEMTGLYWHFVDIVWIFLFPLLYLIGRHL